MLAEYIWIDAALGLRSKTRVIQGAPPTWSFDGSSTGQATGERSDCLLYPIQTFKDPLRGGDNILVLCEVMNPDGTDHVTNHRAKLDAYCNDNADTADCWFGLEQEYILFKGENPLGWVQGEKVKAPRNHGAYYCGVGAGCAIGRDLVEEHLQACLNAGIKISGINAEVTPGQWEFQVGPLTPLAVGDHLWVARWLLRRIGEKYGYGVSLHPKPCGPDWNGSGCHANYSNLKMRQGDNEAIQAWCQRASKRVPEHLAVYGEGIEKRLTGKHETCSYKDFRWGVSDRTSSIRIPLTGGYLEDRRPNANACPYQVAKVILETDFGL